MHQGFERFFILNGHGGNKLPARLRDLHLEGVVRIAWYDWWRDAAVRQFEQRTTSGSITPTGAKTSPSPASPRCPPAASSRSIWSCSSEGQTVREVLGDGSYGGPYQVDDSLMQTLFMQIVEEAAQRVEALRAS